MSVLASHLLQRKRKRLVWSAHDTRIKKKDCLAQPSEKSCIFSKTFLMICFILSLSLSQEAEAKLTGRDGVKNADYFIL